MSHQPERKEKDCLNCGAEVQGRYCQRCGQENIVSQQSFFALVKHFVYDIFHFDGKFFDTLKTLFIKPGLVPAHYIQGKRHRYLDPIRMYLFTSALFFLIFFSTQKFDSGFVGDTTRYMTKTERYQEAARLFSQFSTTDSIANKKLGLMLDTTHTVRIDKVGRNTKLDTVYNIKLNNVVYNMSPVSDTVIFVDGEEAEVRDNWFNRRIETKWKEYKRQYGDDINLMLDDFSNKFIHWFPYILFVSLPFFALLLKLLYKRQKRFFYSDHAVFTLYHYIFSFLLILVLMAFEGLHDRTKWGFLMWIIGLLSFAWVLYLYLSLKNFYKQSWLRTFWKFLALNFLGFLVINLIFIFFTFLFIYQL